VHLAELLVSWFQAADVDRHAYNKLAGPAGNLKKFGTFPRGGISRIPSATTGKS
jgi:hypothetical protein